MKKARMYHQPDLNPTSLALGLALCAGLLCTLAAAQLPPADPPAGTTVEDGRKSWFESKKRDPEFMQLYQGLLQHVKRVDAAADELKVADFPPGKDWFNSAPLSFQRELAGKVVVLDFWTYCCINCIHVLPDLAALEKQYAGYPVAFVGVHSAKFENEKVSENIRQAVLRYGIEHPVINDDEMTMWRGLGVSSWPTLMVIGPKANALLMVSGEGRKDIIDACIAACLQHYPADVFKHEPLPIALERDKSPPSPLRFPGKLAIDSANERLFISDSNHNRIVVTDLDGKHLETIGSGRIGLDDGPFARCTFNRPQGIAWREPHLYVADAENHALRRVDFAKRSVETLVGNGEQGHDRYGGLTGADQLLSTPWDVVLQDQRFFIAMAGTHQIWTYAIAGGVCRNFSGDGSEQNRNDDDRLTAAWAQPSGLSIGAGDFFGGGPQLFVADSESSTVRAIDLDGGKTRTVVGGDDGRPTNLFAFGDRDGTGDQARLQHCLGVLWHAGLKRVITADTYNHRIKLVDPKTRSVSSWVGSGVAGLKDGAAREAQFAEPSGLALSEDGRRLYVADANNHAIRVIAFDPGDPALAEVSTLELTGVPTPLAAEAPRHRRLADLPGTSVVRIDPLKLATGSKGRLVLALSLPADHEYTEGAESRWQVLADPSLPVVVREKNASGTLTAGKEIEVPLDAGAKPGRGLIRVEALAYFCKKGENCSLGAVVFEIPVEVSDSSGAESPGPESSVGTEVRLEHAFGDKSPGLDKLFDQP